MAKKTSNTTEEIIQEQEANNTEAPITDKSHKKHDKNRQIAIDILENWPSINEIWQTKDGTCFFTLNAAANHARGISSDVIRITRTEIIKE